MTSSSIAIEGSNKDVPSIGSSSESKSIASIVPDKSRKFLDGLAKTKFGEKHSVALSGSTVEPYKLVGVGSRRENASFWVTGVVGTTS